MSLTKEQCETILEKKEIMPEEVKALLEARTAGVIDFVLMDIREPYEYEDAHIKGCDVLVPTTQFIRKIDVVNSYKDKKVVMYCRTANRTAQVLNYLVSKGGYENYSHMIYGIVSYPGEIVR